MKSAGASWRTGRGAKSRRKARLDRKVVGAMVEDEVMYEEGGD